MFSLVLRREELEGERDNWNKDKEYIKGVNKQRNIISIRMRICEILSCLRDNLRGFEKSISKCYIYLDYLCFILFWSCLF